MSADEQSPDHGPIETEYRAQMKAIAVALDELLNPPAAPGLPQPPKKVGFMLTLFEFGPPHPGARFNYISNADHLDVLATLKDIAARLEGRKTSAGRA